MTYNGFKATENPNEKVISKKDIKKDEELLLDYPKDYNRFWLNKKNKEK